MARNKTKQMLKTQPRRNLLWFWLAFAGLVLVGLAVFALTRGQGQPKANGDADSQARISVDQELIDHGEVKLGTTIRDEVRVSNTGSQPLRFEEAPYLEVKEGC